jgi:hypothetical protein
MSNNEPDDESADSQQESEQQPADNDQPTVQSDEQSAEQTDQSTEQSEEQAADTGQQADQSEDQSAESDQAAEQSDEQASDSDQPAGPSDQVADRAGEQADQGNGGAGSATEDVSGDTVAFARGAMSPAAGGGSGATKVSARNLKVIAEFAEEGNKFIGDILIHVFESDNGQQGRLLFQTDGQYWQDTNKKGDVITTPMLRVGTSEVLVFAHARVLLPNGDYQTMDTQDFKIPMPSGDTLQIKFDVGVGEIEKTINAPDADKAKAIAIQSPQLKGHYVLPPGLDAQPAGNQQFRVTGKFLSGDISLL